MQIDSALNLTFPITWRDVESTDANGEPVLTREPAIWAYHTTIGRLAYEASHRLIAATNFDIFSEGAIYAAATGPQRATLVLRDAAARDALRYPDSSQRPLLAEIKRLTQVVAPGDHGFQPVPVDVAIGMKVIDAEDWAEAESALVFFTVGSWMQNRASREQYSRALASVLRGSMTSSSATEFADSLTTSTTRAVSARTEASSVPS